MTTLTIEQQIAKKEAEIARLKKQKNALSNGQKIILGGALLAKARKDRQVADFILRLINEEVTRDSDKKRLAETIEEIKQILDR